ncbi:MAG: hypothetical protein ACK5OB_18225 [Pirellula sp.]
MAPEKMARETPPPRSKLAAAHRDVPHVAVAWRLSAGMLCFWLVCGLGAQAQNEVTLESIDEGSGAPVPSRIEFLKSAKRLKVDRKIPTYGDNWLCDGTLPLQPSTGDFEFMARRGPEFKEIRGGFTIEGRAKDSVVIAIPRAVDMHAEDWYSGDLGSEIAPESSSLWQTAEVLDMVVDSSLAPAPATPKKTASGRAKSQPDSPSADTDPNRVGYRWKSSSSEFRSPELNFAIHRPGGEASSEKMNTPSEALQRLRESTPDANAILEVTQLLSRDVPILVAQPNMKLARVLNSGQRPKSDDALLHPKRESPEEFARLVATFGKDKHNVSLLAPIDPQERIRFKSQRGAGMLAEHIYWQLLEAGLRIAPSAASGFGRGDTHLGYNRTYAYIDSEPSADAWWKAAKDGSLVVTNGPLLRALINGVPPGAVQSVYDSQPLPLSINVSLAVREPVDYLDVIFNGETLYSAKLEEHYRKGEFPEISIDRSGWLVIRVITEHDAGYRMASTAPFYYEFNEKPRISRRACEFFQTWLQRSEARILADAGTADAYRELLESANRFWEERLQQANAP